MLVITNRKCAGLRFIDEVELTAFDLEDAASRERFVRGDAREVAVPGSNKTVPYDPMKRTGVAVSPTWSASK